MSIYYTVIDDFGNIDPNIGQLDEEVRTYMTDNPSDITPVFHGISMYLNEIDVSLPPYIAAGKTIVEFHFDSALSGPEKIILDGLIGVHVAVFNVVLNENIIIPYSIDTTKHSTYRRATKPISFQGITYAMVKSISYMESDVTSYDVKIYDKTNNVVVLETNLTNTSESEQELGIMTNISSTPWVLEISVKKNGGSGKSKVYLESVQICYNKV